jgi:hypothetical protein
MLKAGSRKPEVGSWKLEDGKPFATLQTLLIV